MIFLQHNFNLLQVLSNYPLFHLTKLKNQTYDTEKIKNIISEIAGNLEIRWEAFYFSQELLGSIVDLVELY